MNIDRGILVEVVNIEQSQRIPDFIGKQVLIPFTLVVSYMRISRVIGCSRIEHLVHIILDIAVALRTEDTQFQLQMFVEKILGSIQLGCKILHIRILQGTLTENESQRSTKTGSVCTRRERDVMILGETHIALNLIEEIGIATHIGIGQTQRLGCLTIFGSRHHIQIFIDRVYTKLTIVAKAGISQLALGCGNNDDTGSTT